LRKRSKVFVAVGFFFVIFLVGFYLWLNRPKPPYQHVPFSTEDFMGYPSELVIESSEGEFDNYTLALASYESTSEAFVGLKIWSLDFHIDSINDDQWFEFHNIEVLAFTKEDDLELRELTFLANVSANEHAQIWPAEVADMRYNLELVDRDHNGDHVQVFRGVGYSNRTGFRTSGMYEIYKPSSSSLHELILTVTLSYARGPFGLYGTDNISISLKVTVRQ